MLTKLKNRIENEKGFTLIELLVVILIIGILAAIAIPSFLNQREKGQDACAKAQVRTAQTALETYFTDNNSYTTSLATLNTVETQVPATTTAGCDNRTAGTQVWSVAAHSSGTIANTFVISATSASGRAFTLTRNASGVITRLCGTNAAVGDNNTSSGGCKSTGSW